jgi:hypothetical protein
MELLVNSTTVDHQFEPAVCPLDGEKAVVAWTNVGRVTARVIRTDGTNVTGEIPLNKDSDGLVRQTLPAVAGRPLGKGFIAAWVRSGAKNDVNVQMFNADGSLSGSTITLGTEGVDFDVRPVVLSPLQNGRFAVAWVRNDSGRSVVVQAFKQDGSPDGGIRRVSGDDGQLGRGLAGTSLSASGGFALAWIVGGQKKEVRARLFNSDGSTSGEEIAVDAGKTVVRDGPLAITELNNGGFVVGWIANVPPTGKGIVVFRRHDPDGEGFKARPIIHLTDDAAKEKPATQPVLRGLRKGGFIAVWTEDTGDASLLSDIAARVVTNETEFREKFRVNDTTIRGQFGPAAAALTDHVVVAWTDQSETGGDKMGMAVRANILPSP